MSDKRNAYVGWNTIWGFLNFLYSILYSIRISSIWNSINANVWPGITFNETKTREFNVVIYKDELENIREWVRKKDDIETGGDLFGLWIDKHTVVVQLVLGPGKNCRRTTTSFYQDLNYLDKCGKAITKGHGLCNIGQWHSHHRLHLDEPSTGDEDTVWGEMPRLGLNRFVVFIATIREAATVNINPFLFEIDSESGERLPVLKGTVHTDISAQHSPLRLDRCLLRKLEQDAESMNSLGLSVAIDIPELDE